MSFLRTLAVSALPLALLLCAGCSASPAPTGGQGLSASEATSEAGKARARSESPSASASTAAREPDEEALQVGKGINGDLPDPPDTYEEIVDFPPGIYQRPRKDDPEFAAKDAKWRADIKEAMKAIQPPKDKHDKNEINRIFKQILYLAAWDYEPLEDYRKFGYVITKDDPIHPETKLPVIEDGVVNIEVVLDASGSMAKQINGQSMMEIAKASINQVIAELPPTAKVGLRVYGHKGNNKAAGKAESCAANELLAPIAPNNGAAVSAALAGIQPTGWTPLAASIEAGSSDLNAIKGERDLNMLYVVSDGIETCDGDPLAAAQAAKASNNELVLGIIGFNVDANQDQVLQKIAEAGGGHYANANDAAKLTSELQRIHELAQVGNPWQPLTLDILNQLESQHREGLKVNSSVAHYIDEEKENIDKVIDLGVEVGIYDKDIWAYERLKYHSFNRNSVIDSIYYKMGSEIHSESFWYQHRLFRLLIDHDLKDQQIPVIVQPVTSRRMPSSPYYIPPEARGN